MKAGHYWVKYLDEWTVGHLLDDDGLWLIPGCENTHVIEEMDEVVDVLILDYKTISELKKIHDKMGKIPPFTKGGFT